MNGARAEDYSHDAEWLEANRRLSKASGRLDAVSHLPESAAELMAATSDWRAAKSAYEAVCARIDREP